MGPVQVAKALGGDDKGLDLGRLFDKAHGQTLAEQVHERAEAAAQHRGDVAARHRHKEDAVGPRVEVVERPEPRRRLEQEMAEMVPPDPGKKPAAGKARGRGPGRGGVGGEAVAGEQRARHRNRRAIRAEHAAGLAARAHRHHHGALDDLDPGRGEVAGIRHHRAVPAPETARTHRD